MTLQAHVFKSKSGACAAFLANYNSNSYARVSFGNMHYNLPPWSISILPDCKNTVYNTARVRKIPFSKTYILGSAAYRCSLCLKKEIDILTNILYSLERKVQQ